ncbi:MAG TPA: hypothetical protein PLP33_25385 [Leptospiraceae bacterium]|nr:hypothetical protein [Leptospiraceae bacterium]
MIKYKVICGKMSDFIWASNRVDAWSQAVQWARKNKLSTKDMELEEA